MKILIIRFSSLGDIVLTTPVIRAIKLQLPDVEIHYCTKAAYSFLVDSNIYVDKVHVLEGSLLGLSNTLKKEKFDYVIDLHHNLRTLFIKAMTSVKGFSYPKMNVRKWLLVKLKINKLPNTHLVDRYMQTALALGVKKDSQGLDYFIPEKDEVENDWLPETHRNGYVAYAIGGKFATKRLPVTRMIELCDKINKPIVLLGGKEDQSDGEMVKEFFDQSEGSDINEESLKQLNKKAIIFNGCGKFNINQSASIIKNAQVVFSHDTGMMHIAAAFRKKIYSIWGSTIPEFGMYPYKTSFVIFENKKIKCRPCSKIGFQHCPKGHFKCMNDVVFDFYLP